MRVNEIHEVGGVGGKGWWGVSGTERSKTNPNQLLLQGVDILVSEERVQRHPNDARR